MRRMTTCQACGSELDEELDKCPYCGFVFKSPSDKTDSAAEDEKTAADTGGEQEKAVQAQDASDATVTPAVTAAGFDLSDKLQEMKSKIDQLSQDTPDKEEQPEALEETVAEPEPVETVVEVEITEESSDASEMEEPPPPEDEEAQTESVVETLPDDAESVEPPIEAEVAAEETESYEEVSEEAEEYEEIGVEEQRSLSEQSLEDLGLTYDEARAVRLPERYAQKIRPAQVKTKKGRGKKVAAALISILLILVAWQVLFGLPFWPESEEIIPSVDGQFDDWAEVVSYGTLWASDNTDINFQASAVQLYGDDLFWHFVMVEDLYHTASQVTSYSLLIDADGTHSTGYSLIGDFGADLMITISGSGGQKVTNELSRFSSSDQHNWSAWTAIDSELDVAVVNNQAETCFSLPDSGASYSTSAMRFASVAYDGVSRTSATPFFILDPGVLVIAQTSLVSSDGAINISQGEEILELRLRYFGQVHGVDSIDPQITGASMSGHLSAPEQTLEQYPAGLTLSVVVDTSSLDSGTIIRAELAPSMVDSDFPTVMVIGKGAVGYIDDIPSWISIEGIFSDWTNISEDNDTAPIRNPNVDIASVSLETNSTDICIFSSVAGTIMEGELIPEGRTVIGSSGPVVIPDLPPRVTGWDMLRVFIDTDPSGTSGAESPVNYSDITPDYKLEIFGRNGQIEQQTLFIWEDDSWNELLNPDISLVLGTTSFELRISADEVSNPGSISVLIQIEDWLGVKDFSSELP